MTRVEQIYALLTSLYDYLPSPKTASYGDLPGPAPTTTGPCKACGGAGHFGKKRRQCAPCKGTGVVAIDGYTGEQVGTKTSRVQSADARRIDAELRQLATNEQIRRGRMLDDPFRWEAERIRYRRHGSYAALERALEHLRANLPETASAIMRYVVYASVPIGPGVREVLDAGVEHLSHRMPSEIKVPGWVSAAPAAVTREWPSDRRRTIATKERNARIIELRESGMTQKAIAAEVGVNQPTVSRVLASVKLAGTAA